MQLTLLQELESILQATLVADKQQTPILLSPVVSLLIGSDLGSVLDTTTDDAVRVDTRDWNIAARVHLAHVCCEGTGLLRVRLELELVVAVSIFG